MNYYDDCFKALSLILSYPIYIVFLNAILYSIQTFAKTNSIHSLFFQSFYQIQPMGKNMMIACFIVLLCTLEVICVKYTLLHSAVPKGAVCLDGTPPAYAYSEGCGDGSTNWLVYLEGGAWCGLEEETCQYRSTTYFGSTGYGLVNKEIPFNAILESDCQLNPDFYNWHKVYVHYCDGSLFMSDVDQVDPTNNLTFRGGRIYNVVMEELLGKGMRNAHNAILAGSSAGGLSTILHCDRFRALFPNTTRVKCISDSGFFIRGEGELAKQSESHFAQVIAANELRSLLPTSCTSKRDPNLCLFAEYLVEDVATPLFILEAAFDMYQIKTNFILTVPGLDRMQWENCSKSLEQCNATEIGIIKDFGPIFKKTLMKLGNSSSRGVFLDSCYLHLHFYSTYNWISAPVLHNKTIQKAIGDWFYDRSTFQEIDNPLYPQNCYRK
ncbi:pectin acetylesterase 7-like [Salvia splendens]|uniref:pectin acetylesterase 7-like n=1 Tax=Salvia splendens TaxID=180675 RepID=UPI001C27FCB7|nr:pectin acetylesterase 7-like [Salvia splendens]